MKLKDASLIAAFAFGILILDSMYGIHQLKTSLFIVTPDLSISVLLSYLWPRLAECAAYVLFLIGAIMAYTETKKAKI